MQFEQLHLSPLISQAVKSKGYTTPTPIQQEAIPAILSGRDVIGKAPTGTGKTAAFMLPALHKIAESEHRQKPQILVLTPTRELATQITNVIYDYGKEIQIKPISILGGMPYREQQRKLAKPHDILVATPGRLIDYINNNNLDLSNISMLILDEADRMLDMGFIDDVEFIASKISKKRQTLLFTATMDKRLITLSQHILRSPQMVEVKNQNITLDNINQKIYIANDTEHKFKLLQNLLQTESIFKAIIFSATKRNADKLAKSLTHAGYPASALHGDMNQKKRNRTIADFRTGKIQFLIATDVAARGIDINDISHVINYDLPKFAEDYVHRIGRTGRAGRDGVAISLVLSSDHVNLKKIEKFTKQAISRHTVKGLEPHTQPKAEHNFNKHGQKHKPKQKFGHKFERDFRDKPKKKFGGNNKHERNFNDRNDRGDRFEKRSFGDKPKKNFRGNSDRNSERNSGRSFERNFNDRKDHFEKRGFGDKPKKNFRGNSDRNSERNSERSFERNFNDRNDRFEKRSFGDKPKKNFGHKSERSFERNFDGRDQRAEKKHFGHKPKKNFGNSYERSFSERSEKRNFGDKPKKNFGHKSERSFERNFDGRDERSEKRNFSPKPKKNFGSSNERNFGKKDFKKTFSKDSKKPFKRHFKKDKA